MDRPRPLVIRPSDAPPPPGPPTHGMERRQLFVSEDTWVGWVRTEPGAGGWHHHGDHDSYIYLIRGAMTIQYGAGGNERATAHAGDVIFNPRGMIHREVTEGSEQAEVFVVRHGSGPQTVNVDGPER